MAEMISAKKLKINGIVQGVGFRPFLFQLAKKHQLNGSVANTPEGVLLHIEGGGDSIRSFEADLVELKPMLAEISDIDSESVTPEHYSSFTIIKSGTGNMKSTMISPDVSICGQCLAELNDPDDRRYGYPFINCTNCGPRYSIIEDVPYDRPKTSMKHFLQCTACLSEYNDPENRRFHAQPNACPECGPHVLLADSRGNQVPTETVFRKTVELIKEGRIIAIKGLGGFHLACDASNQDTVERLRKIKDRGTKPFAVMASSLDSVRQFAHVDRDEASLLESFRKPVVLLEKLKETGESLICDGVAPYNRFIGVMMPYTPVHALLFGYDVKVMVMTSGNRRNEPIVIDNDEAFETLYGLADFFLINNRDIYLRSDDSVVKYVSGKTRFLRRARGYVPAPIVLKRDFPPILACGGELKNTVCLLKKNNACLSQHIGDLDTPKAYDFLKMTVDHLQRILDVTPVSVAHDLHPDYLSTRLAEEAFGDKTIGIQHHHAHIASCMAENRVDGPVIGLAFDGTGMGDDGKLWGGEVFVADYTKFKRMAHLDWLSMPGGEAAIREPWRMGISMLYDVYGEGCLDLPIPLIRDTSERTGGVENAKFILQMLEKRVNIHETSSMGRLFDGISSILGIRHKIHYEGQAAIELEMAASGNTGEAYGYQLNQCEDSGMILVSHRPVVQQVVSDLLNNYSPKVISGRFHSTVIRMFSDVCDHIRGETGIDQVVLSGGVFQNSFLLSGFIETLQQKKFNVITHSKVPANDGGLALGQAVIAGSLFNG